MQMYYDGTIEHPGFSDPENIHLKLSVNDDLEAMFQSASDSTTQNSTVEKEKDRHSFLYKKLTTDEMKLIEKQDSKILNQYQNYIEQDCYTDVICGIGQDEYDIDLMKLKKSDHESRYAFLHCTRMTLFLQNSWLKDHHLFFKQQTSKKRTCQRKTGKNRRNRRRKAVKHKHYFFR